MFNYHQSKLFEKAINQPIISNYRKKRRESVPLIINKKGSASKHAYFTSDQKQTNIKDLKPRLTKSMNFPISSSSSILKMKASQLHLSKWDPHIDQLDILYAKMNGIAALSTSPPLPHSTLSTNSSIHSIAHSTSTSSQFNNDGFQYSIQAVSPTTTHFSFDDYSTTTTTTATTTTNNNQQKDYYNSNNNNSNNMDFSLLKKIEEYNDDDDGDDNNNGYDMVSNLEDELYSTKALLTMILSITNQLIQARFDYLSEEMFNLNDENKEEKKFMMHFLSTCIQQAECLEQLISSQLKSKRTLNQYLHNHINMNDDEEKEKEKELIQWYHDHILQCIQLYEQQLFMTDTLQDILKEFEQENLELVVDDYNNNDHHQQQHNQYNNNINNNDENNDCHDRWDFQQPIDQLLGFEDMNDRLSSLKYQVGMFIGEGLGTGHLIHSNKKKSKIIKKKKSKKNDSSPSIEKSSHVKSMNHHHHQKDNIDNQSQPIYYLSRLQWVKDELINQCQFNQCKNKFSFFLRKHHCRRCGQIICHEHSTHQLPLYKKIEKDNSLSSPYLLCWSRVCDHCYILYT